MLLCAKESLSSSPVSLTLFHAEYVTRGRSETSFERCSDLLGRDGKARGVGVAVARRIQQGRGERREERRRRGKGDERREEKSESRPIRAPRQGDLCLIRRSRLAEAVRTGIHIRYGLGSGFTLVLVFLARIRPRQLHRQLSQHLVPNSPLAPDVWTLNPT